jgi:peroxiredoxin
MQSFNTPVADLLQGPNLTSWAVPNVNLPSIPITPGIPSLLVFARGSYCPHCISQLATLSEQLSEKQVDVFVISSSDEDDLKAFPRTSFHLIADPDLRLFKAHGVEGRGRHATIVLDAGGTELFRSIGERPLEDASLVVQALERGRVSATK